MREIPGIPYSFKNPELLTLALSHRSVGRLNNERLEFLGDSILNFVVSARLFDLKTDNNEGGLSRLRARVVRGETLAKLASELKLGDYIKLGEGESKSGGYKRNSILADVLEAVFGAIYLDGGFEPCERVIQHVCDPYIAGLPDAGELKDSKTLLQEYLQGRGYGLPEYSLLKAEGPPHRKEFLIQCVNQAAEIKVTGKGRSRRKAEQVAAAVALDSIAEGPEE
ncbi:MAG: ribonuclease III [Gammaproteobacteria bacterium]|nr:ribonuclease III [Gammaproteobacteria bacterium]